MLALSVRYHRFSSVGGMTMWVANLAEAGAEVTSTTR